MAVAFVTESDVQGSGASVTVNAPASIVSGNLLVAVLSGVSSSAHGGPTGWTMAGSGYDATSTMQLTVFTKVATGSEPSTYTFTSGTGNLGVYVGQYSGTVSLDGTPTFTHGTSNSVTGASQTPTATGDALLFGVWGAGSMSFTTPTSMTYRCTSPGGFIPSTYDRILASTSPTGTITTTGSFSNDWESVSLLLLAGAAPVSGTATCALGPVTLTATGTVLGTLTGTATLPLGPVALATTGIGVAVPVITIGPVTTTVSSSSHAGSGQLASIIPQLPYTQATNLGSTPR